MIIPLSTLHVKNIQNILLKQNVKISLNDIKLLYKCKINNDFVPMFSTKLYQKRGMEYCRLLEVMHSYLS